MYAEGRLRFATDASSKKARSPSGPRPRTLDDLNEKDQKIVGRRWYAIEPLTKLEHRLTGDDLRQRAEELERQGTPCSARSLRRYWSAWKKAGDDRLALIPATTQGRRGRSRRNGMFQQHPRLRQFVDAAIRSVYLTNARRPVSAVTRRVMEDMQRHNARLIDGQALPVPRQSALGRAIARRIGQLDPWEVDRERWGKRIADRRHAPTKSRRQAKRILERVEIDHCLLKVVVGTDAGPIGQPWLTVLVDYHSRMIVGFCIGFDPPSYAVVMEALRHAILPKSYLKDRYPRIEGSWPCYGIPEKLVCDRGSDLISKDLERAAFQLGIELDFNPPRMPHFKGTVESFFDVLSDQLLSSLPGRTFRSWQGRADYQPDDGPLISYEGLLEVIHIHLTDVYSASKHPASTKTRLEMWQESAAEHPPCLPPSPDDLVVLLAKHVERTLSARGLELCGMFYNSDELMALRAELAANNIRTNRLQVRYNPWDLGHVWIRNPVDDRYLKASAADAVMQGMTEYQWKVLKRAVRERFDQPAHLLDLASGRNAIRDVVEEAISKPSRKRRVRAARYGQTQPATDRTDRQLQDDEWVDVASHETQPPAEADTSCDGPDTQPDPDRTERPSSDQNSKSSPDEIELADIDVDDWDVVCGQ